MKYLVSLISCFLWLSTFGQEEDERQKTFDKRILFILDGSGSMKESWQNESKWEMAVQTLSNLIDSFQSVNTDFEIGIRVLGYQFPREAHRCDDSRLVIPFTKTLNYATVNSVLTQLKPQGHTPLAYSIAQSEMDFPQDITALHSIILITDGLENCGGNPCEVAQKLKEKNIFITPYIIGLGIDSLESEKLECIGKFVDARSKEVFKKVIQNILTEVSLKTTLSVFFTDKEGNPIPHYVPYSLIDKKTKRDISNFIYTSNSKKSLDTILINPQYVYSLLVHTHPDQLIDTYRLVLGTHNVWTVPYDYGEIELEPRDKKVRVNYILRDQQNEMRKIYSLSDYNHLPLQDGMVDVMEYPNHSKLIHILPKKPSRIFVSAKGILKIRLNEKLKVSIYDMKWNFVMHLSDELLKSYELIAGDYYILYKKSKDILDKSKFQSIHIGENQILPIALP